MVNSGNNILSLSVHGGMFDDQRMIFDCKLNCIIGGRGTGKTTALEFIRHALGTERSGGTAKRVAALLKENLKGGHIELAIRSRDGLEYTIRRGMDGPTVVQDGDGNAVDLSVNSLIEAGIYGQDEIERIAVDTDLQLDLIDSFDANAIRETQKEIDALKRQLGENARLCMESKEKAENLRDEANQLDSVKAKLREFADLGGENVELIEAAHAAKSLRNREARALAAIGGILTEYRASIETLIGKLDTAAADHFPAAILESSNGNLLKPFAAQLRECGQETNDSLQAAVRAVDEIIAGQRETALSLADAHRWQEIEYQDVIAKDKEAQDKSGERTKWEHRKIEIEEAKKQYDTAAAEMNRLREERRAMLDGLSDLRDRRYDLRRAITDRINESTGEHIRVSIRKSGGIEEYRQILENALRDSPLKQGVVAGKIAETIPPWDLAELICDGEIDAIRERANLNPDQAQKVMTTLSESENLFAIEAAKVTDLSTIELRDGEEWKESEKLSTGQKCTAILPILLLEGEKPLLIDQPEDNLDNRFIFTNVVERIREVKKTRQLIFVTHNPNIPVLGEAEKVFVLESDGASARKKTEGSVDDCRGDIINLLEGGAEAFEERRRRYGLPDEQS